VQVVFLLAFLALVLLAGERPYWDPKLAAGSLGHVLRVHVAMLGVLAALVLLAWGLGGRKWVRWPVAVAVLSLAQIALLVWRASAVPEWNSKGFEGRFVGFLAAEIVVLLAFVGLLTIASPGSNRRSPAWLKWPYRLLLVGLALLLLRLVLLLSTGLNWEPIHWPESLFGWGPGPDWNPRHWLDAFFAVDPLVLVLTWLAAHAVPLALLWSLVVVAATVLLGRVFCGWVCPLGTIHAGASHVLRPRKPGGEDRDRWSPWQRTKYYVLIGLLVMAVFGVHWGAVFDPLVLLYRTTTTAILPTAWWSVEDPWKIADAKIADRRAAEDEAIEARIAAGELDEAPEPSDEKPAIDPVYQVLRKNVYLEPHPGTYLGVGLILALFVGMVALNAYRRRFWCRYVCPLGALLGIFSWRPLLRRATVQANCNQCDLCGMACHGAAAARGGQAWCPSECLGCLNCTDACSRDSLGFQLAPPWRKEPEAVGIGLTRRAAVAAAVSGLAALPILRISPQSRGRTFNPDLIRPPGAQPEREFLARCTACGLCIKVCPTGGLQPTLTEAGLEGIWTPHLVPQLGYCDYECNRCGQVCPTQAIRPFVLEEKKQIRIGVAVIDVTRCLPYAFHRPCITCEEQCPVLPKKAIEAPDVPILDENGKVELLIRQPRVDPALCIGCGKCENVCPYHDRPAIRVSSAGESRHPANQPFQRAEEGPYG